jgi:hypothetical protein
MTLLLIIFTSLYEIASWLKLFIKEQYLRLFFYAHCFHFSLNSACVISLIKHFFSRQMWMSQCDGDVDVENYAVSIINLLSTNNHTKKYYKNKTKKTLGPHNCLVIIS